ncbi:MAG: hypothetical protein HDR20_07980 [Lachnospiraceae bacterium]|nr:hypothetical protein [Lachnospiraceae bacterium]
MDGKQKSIFIRFNMDNRADKELYLKLSEGADDSASLTAYVKKVLEEYFSLNIKIADRQEFHNQMLVAVREEVQVQGMKLVGALLAGIGSGNIPVQQLSTVQNEQRETILPEACEELPDGLSGVLDLIS